MNEENKKQASFDEMLAPVGKSQYPKVVLSHGEKPIAHRILATESDRQRSCIKKEEVSMSKAEVITVPIEVDTKGLKEALRLAKELETTLEKANRLLGQLTSDKN
ncbi:hypothetical protein [Lacticaseibacillus salsurivasis]|uniref:hypothetical protein n=1 Tax=Lacticaseibacillus salsurivasis TaxID=3081441 RepID=UPI0030C6A037